MTNAIATATTIKPGLMVALRTSVTGGVRYERTDLPVDPAVESTDGKSVLRWETERVIEDAAEFEAAQKARANAGSEIRRVCAATSFGLLCAAADEDKLNEAMARARAIVDAFNATAKYSVVTLHLLKGRIASTDEAAARAIGAEVTELIATMNASIDRLDPEAIRKAAAQALQLSAVLSDERQLAVGAAVDAARRAARMIVKRVQKEGELASVVLADIQRGAIEKARIAFLDTSDDAVVEGEPMPVADMQRVASLDFDEIEAPIELPTAHVPAIDFDTENGDAL